MIRLDKASKARWMQALVAECQGWHLVWLDQAGSCGQQIEPSARPTLWQQRASVGDVDDTLVVALRPDPAWGDDAVARDGWSYIPWSEVLGQDG